MDVVVYFKKSPNGKDGKVVLNLFSSRKENSGIVLSLKTE
jgi:hypothetical protein